MSSSEEIGFLQHRMQQLPFSAGTPMLNRIGPLMLLLLFVRNKKVHFICINEFPLHLTVNLANVSVKWILLLRAPVTLVQICQEKWAAVSSHASVPRDVCETRVRNKCHSLFLFAPFFGSNQRRYMKGGNMKQDKPKQDKYGSNSQKST